MLLDVERKWLLLTVRLYYTLQKLDSRLTRNYNVYAGYLCSSHLVNHLVKCVQRALVVS